jgi:hypothetical protein
MPTFSRRFVTLGVAALAVLATLVAPREARAQRKITFVNQCSETVWVGALGNPGKTAPLGGGWTLAPGASNSVTVPTAWAGRFWGRRNCAFDAAGNGTCQTGDCGGKLQCNGAGGAPPTSLAEFTMNGHGNQDYYDISLVDGYDFPLRIAPSPANTSPSNKYQCGTPTCTSDLLKTCPAPLQKKNAAGQVIACMSACEAFKTDQYCCRGAFDKPETCKSSTWPVNYPAFFKAACPDAYSYAYDDTSSTYVCSNPFPDYTVTFCPGGANPPPPPPPSTGISPTAWYNVINTNSTKCVDQSGWQTANGTPVQQYGCGSGQANQEWQFVPTDSGYYKIVPRHASWLALDVTGGPGATGLGVKVQLWGYGGGANQQWKPVSLGGGLWKLVARHSGKCLDVPGASIDQGVVLQQWDCNGTGAQSFRLVQRGGNLAGTVVQPAAGMTRVKR